MVNMEQEIQEYREKLTNAGIDPDKKLETMEDYLDTIKKCKEAGIIKNSPKGEFYPRDIRIK